MNQRIARLHPRYGRIVQAVPVIVLALAALGLRTPLAAAFPLPALLLALWAIADTTTLALMIRTGGRPGADKVLAVLAGASLSVWAMAPPVLRAALADRPTLALLLALPLLGHVGWAALRAQRQLRSADGSMADRVTAAASELLPPALVRLAAAELAILHMALFRWGGPADVPADSRAFAYHRHITPMGIALLLLSAIEIGVYHLLVGHWSSTGAIVMFALSDFGFIYLVGLIKSFRYRPILLTPEGIRIRAGFLIDHIIAFEDIAEVSSEIAGETVRDPATLNAALIAWPNVIVTLRQPQARKSLLRRRPPFVRIAFRLDDPAPFVRLLRWRLGQRP